MGSCVVCIVCFCVVMIVFVIWLNYCDNEGVICVRGVCIYNFKDVEFDILWGKLVVMMGLSGFGKSMLVIDMIFVEG